MKRGCQLRQPSSAASNRNKITCSDDYGALHRKAYDTHAPLLWESGPPSPTLAHMPLPKSSRARLSPSICFISKLRIGLTSLIEPAYSVSGSFFCFRPAWQVVDGTLRVGAFVRGRCDRRGKYSGPPLLKPSLKVKRNSAHSQSSMFVVAPPHGRNEPGRLMVCLGHTSDLLGLEQAIKGGVCRVLSGRSQPRTSPLHRMSRPYRCDRS